MTNQLLMICLSLCALWQPSLGQEEHILLTLNEETSELQEVACDKFKYYAVEVTDPCRDLRVRVRLYICLFLLHIQYYKCLVLDVGGEPPKVENPLKSGIKCT